MGTAIERGDVVALPAMKLVNAIGRKVRGLVRGLVALAVVAVVLAVLDALLLPGDDPGTS